MTGLVARVRVILTAAVTWLVVLAAVLTVVVDELAAAIGADHPVVVLIFQAVAVIGVAISIIVRVTPVLPGAEGLLPAPAGTPVTEYEAELMHQLHAYRRGDTPAAAGNLLPVEHDP